MVYRLLNEKIVGASRTYVMCEKVNVHKGRSAWLERGGMDLWAAQVMNSGNFGICGCGIPFYLRS